MGYFGVFCRFFFGYIGIPLPPLADPDLITGNNDYPNNTFYLNNGQIYVLTPLNSTIRKFETIIIVDSSRNGFPSLSLALCHGVHGANRSIHTSTQVTRRQVIEFNQVRDTDNGFFRVQLNTSLRNGIEIYVLFGYTTS